MRLGEHSTFQPRLSIGFKKLLLNLNISLDSIKEDIVFNREYGFYFDHSIYPSSDQLTKLEILILYLEDRRFFVHRGFEFRSLLRLLRRFIRRGKIGGMSTIDQQVVRISTKRSERSLRRKLGSGLIDHIQNMTIAAMAMADMKVWAQRS